MNSNIRKDIYDQGNFFIEYAIKSNDFFSLGVRKSYCKTHIYWLDTRLYNNDHGIFIIFKYE